MIMHESEFLDWVIKGVLAASFAGWAFIVKYFGGKYISSLEEIEKQLIVVRRDIAVLKATAGHKDEHDSQESEE
jgi:hypothetical protein